MKIHSPTRGRGIALIIVMVVILALGVLAGGFAYAMKVEMKLARNHRDEAQMEWLGRSGVELARYVVGQQLLISGQPYDALNQKWAGGQGETNVLLADISLDNVELGPGQFSVKIVDQERKWNINTADAIILQQAFKLIVGDAMESSVPIDSIQDWRDPDENPRLSGAESDYYLGLDPPYACKNGPLDDISELLLIKGITPELYWGGAGSNELNRVASVNRAPPQSGSLGFLNQTMFQGGLVDVFTTISSGLININTASAPVLQIIPGINESAAQQIVQMRAGPDGVEGNEDDTPFRNAGELVNVPGMNYQAVGQLGRYCATRSTTFEVTVTAQIGDYRREFVALLRRNSPRDVQVLYFHWK
jgi:general secretion pathway protein K